MYSDYFCTMNQTKEETVEKAMANFKEGYACSQSVILAFSNEFNLNKNHALAMTSTMGGGMGRLRRTCGALTAGFMVIGLKYGNTEPDDMDNKLNGYRKVREMNKQFEAIHGTSVCEELLAAVATDDQVKRREHHRMICDNCVKTATELTYDMLDQDFSCV
jgi:C_GCAxxG_C_C family probable redox protein